MDENSNFFDKIRINARKKTSCDTTRRCEVFNCHEPGIHPAPNPNKKHRKQLFFCSKHIKSYNESYDFFEGMHEEEVIAYHKDALVGHRPTWSMGVQKGRTKKRINFHTDFEQFLNKPEAPQIKQAKLIKKVYPEKIVRALASLDLDETATAERIRNQYKLFVKKFHPDANGGDRSYEERLREIINSYNFLKASKLC